MAICVQCGSDFESTNARKVYCSLRCRWNARWARQEQVERSHARSRVWYSKPENKISHAAARRGRRLSAATGRGEWEMPAPRLDYLPGGFLPITIECGYRFAHWQLAALHGMMTSITGPHAPNNPVFSLFPYSGGCGWGCYVGDLDLARSIAARDHSIRFDDRDQALTLGCLIRVKAPVIKRGSWLMRITAITPVHCRSTGGSVHYTAPTANNLKGTLEALTARRLGIATEKHDVQVRLLNSTAFPDHIFLGGNGHKLGDIAGWSGSVDVEVNALGRLLIECAALGLGLGGKTAFGFGRIKSEVLEGKCKQVT